MPRHGRGIAQLQLDMSCQNTGPGTILSPPHPTPDGINRDPSEVNRRIHLSSRLDRRRCTLVKGFPRLLSVDKRERKG
jgi:hypothetical protein